MIAAGLWMENMEYSNGIFNSYQHVKERQLAGMLHFAEAIQWPCLSEVKEFCQTMSKNMQSITLPTQLSLHFWDWLNGLVLPGGNFTISILYALYSMTPSLKDHTPRESVAIRKPNYGLVFPQVSYWTSRSVLGKVLAPLPGVKQMAGWVGPCLAPLTPRSLPKFWRPCRDQDTATNIHSAGRT